MAETYLAALKVGDYQACYRMLTEPDLAHGSLDEFLRSVPMGPHVDRKWFHKIESATYYLVEAPVVNGKKAVVAVNVTTPNLVLWERMLGAQSGSKQAIEAAAERQLQRRSYPVLNYPDQIVLVMEDGEWRVLAAFAQRARIARLHDQAVMAYHAYQFENALGLYRRLLERLQKTAFTGSGALARRFGREMKTVQRAKARQEQAQAYLKKLTLKNVVVRPTQSGTTGMFGKITNTGDLPLDQVELTVSYYDLTGKVVFVEKHTPVAIPLEFTDFDMPIVPFRPGQTLDFGFALHASPDIQRQNKARVAPSAVIFSEPAGAPPKLAGVVPGANQPPAAPTRRSKPDAARMDTSSGAKHSPPHRGPSK